MTWLNEERGASEVEPLLERSAISTVNLSEVLQKSLDRGVNVEGLSSDLEALGLTPVPFETKDAENAAALWRHTKGLGLSLGGRACLVTARRLKVPALTADSVWSNIPSPPSEIRQIR